MTSRAHDLSEKVAALQSMLRADLERTGCMRSIPDYAELLSCSEDDLLAAAATLERKELVTVRSDGVCEPHASATFGEWAVVDEIGRGSQARVYRAVSLKQTSSDGRPIQAAVKVRLPSPHGGDDTAHAQHLRESKALSSLTHPSIPRFYGSGETDHQRWIAMMLIRGERLDRFCSRMRRECTPDQYVRVCADLAAQLLECLRYVHAAGLTHRDVKPANIIVGTEGTLSLLDLGVVHADRDVTTVHGRQPGSLPYMSPEQTRGQPADRYFDLWAAAVVLYEMLAGRRPFTGNDGQLVESIQREWEPLLWTVEPSVPLACAHGVHRALLKRVKSRPSSAKALAELIARPGEPLGVLARSWLMASRVRSDMSAARRSLTAWVAFVAASALVVLWLNLGPGGSKYAPPRVLDAQFRNDAIAECTWPPTNERDIADELVGKYWPIGELPVKKYTEANLSRGSRGFAETVATGRWSSDKAHQYVAEYQFAQRVGGHSGRFGSGGHGAIELHVVVLLQIPESDKWDLRIEASDDGVIGAVNSRNDAQPLDDGAVRVLQDDGTAVARIPVHRGQTFSSATVGAQHLSAGTYRVELDCPRVERGSYGADLDANDLQSQGTATLRIILTRVSE